MKTFSRIRHERYQAQLRRRIQDVLEQGGEPVELDPVKDEEEIALLSRMTRKLKLDSPEHRRLVKACEDGGTIEAAMDALGSPDPAIRRRGALICGALQLERALPWIELLIVDRNFAVRLAASGAAGRIGGLRASDALLRAVHARRLPQARAAVELSRAAPDLYVEEHIRDSAHSGAGPVLAMAAGLRRRRSSLEPLLDGLQAAKRRERSLRCRALGKLRDPAAAPTLLRMARHDTSPQVRQSALRALRDLRVEVPESNPMEAMAR
ncbi:MAG TPA: HEAT repeat domain-containing protein [Candidatus Dormibacteraeota bacterium]